MAHLDDTAHDFDDLEHSTLDPEIIKSVRSARVTARDIMNKLEPRHIAGWAELVGILEESLKSAKFSAGIEGLSTFR